MLSATATRTLPTLDDWMLSPAPPMAMDLHRAAAAHRAQVRAVYFGLGQGRTSNLSPADRALVRSYIDDCYTRYRTRAIISGRRPRSRASYIAKSWRFAQRSAWLANQRAALRARIEVA